MALQLNYLAKKGWKPNLNRYLITLIKVELSDKAIGEGKKKGKSIKELFEGAASAVASESSTGTWTKVYSGKDSGVKIAEKYKALAYDINYNKFMFKVAYPLELFELGNMSGLLAGITGNIAGMKILGGLRVFDVYFPEKFVKSFLGPRFGVDGIRKFMHNKKEPFVITVPKPKVGRTAREQAKLARVLFTAGDGSYDGIKDDENLTNLSFNNFDKRAKLVLKELRRAEKKTGRKKIYLCNTTHSDLDEMIRRAELIKKNNGKFMMMDVITTGFSAVDTIRRRNLGLAIHAHRAMHGFMTRDNSPGVQGKGKLYGFSVSMIVMAKIFRLLGVDSLHGGSPLAKMEDYGEAEYIRHVLQDKETKMHNKIPSLGQKWFNIKPVLMTASGGLHPGDFEYIVRKLGKDLIIQFGGGLLGHPDGVEAGVKAIQEARKVVLSGKSIKGFVEKNPNSALARAVKVWGYGPKIV